MKHMKINGKLLNLDKTWRHLSMKQRELIVGQFREEYVGFLRANDRHPKKEERRKILDRVYEKIQEREICIPYGEVKQAFSAKLQKYMRVEVAVKE